MRSLLTNRFEPRRVLKQTSSSITFVGNDHKSEKTDVLIKIIRKNYFSRDRKALATFFSWHRGIQHPYLARLVDAGLTAKQDLYYVREYFSDGLLSTEYTQWIGQLLAAVAALHQGNHIHSRIRPSNIFRSAGSVKLADAKIPQLKINKLTEEDIRFTAPEVLSGSEPTLESDLYSIGAVLYRALSGRDPFDDVDLDNLKTKYVWAIPRPLSSICHVPDAVSELVARLLEKEPHRRPALSSLLSIFPEPVTAHHAPLVGRDETIRTIEDFFERRSPDGLRVILLEGPPGIGKTRLVEELSARAPFHGGDFATGHCNETDVVPLQPIVRTLKSVLRHKGLFGTADLKNELGNFWLTLRRFLDSENSSEADGTYPPERIISDIAGLLTLFAQKNPLTVAIDDIHFADESTLQVIQHLCLRSTESLVNLVLTRRSRHQPFRLQGLMEECLRENFLTIRLTPLQIAASQQLLAFVAKPSEKQSTVLAEAAGNPLFLEEYASCGSSLDKLPVRLETLFLSILRSLSRSSLEMAGVISIFHEPINATFLQRVSQILTPAFDNALAELRDTGLVQTSGQPSDVQLAFQHQSVRQRFYVQMSKSKRTRLHRSAYELLNRANTDEELLAHHSFHGQLNDIAADHCINTAKALGENGNYPAAIKAYTQAKLSLQRLGRELDAAASADLALCYARVGKTASADKIYERLLRTEPAPIENRTLLSSIFTGLTAPESRKVVSERLILCSRALETAPPDWNQLPAVYARLTHLLTQAGQLANAEKALQLGEETVQKNPSESNQALVKGARGYFLLHSGQFREAIGEFQSIKLKNRFRPALLINIALCWEHLGNIKRAREAQLEAGRLAEANGHAGSHVVTLVNLGAFETKLGNFKEASISFTSAASLIQELRRRDSSFRPVLLSVFYLDLARLQIELGQYQKAQRNLKLARKSEILGLEGGHLVIAECELNICLGDTAKTKLLLQGLDRSEVFQTEFFFVERSLIESHLDDTDLEKRLDNLMQALDVSRKLGTLYQRCKLFNQLSVVLRALGRQSEARKYAIDALRLAEKQGYRALAARALLALGLASVNHAREKSLLAALHAASEIGLCEVLAESAFHIGDARHAAGHYITAEEYLLKSTSETKELSQEIPQGLRSRYLKVSWREDAQRLLEDCRSKNQAIVFLRRSLEDDRDQHYIRALYRLSLLSETLKDSEEFISSVLGTLDTSTKRPIILMLQNSKGVVYHSLRIKLSDDLRDRVRLLNQKSTTRIYFGNPDTGRTRDTAAWIPLRAPQQTGGIYVACRHGEAALSEREIEFLTVIGLITNEALHRIDNRAIEEAKSDQVAKVDFHGMIGASKAIREVYSHIQIAAGNAATVLIEGESGTGKELVAKAIHETGQRAKEPFVAVDCGAIPETLIEAELFGARKGSYTGAVVDRPGLFEAAHRGTIFLDEISNTSPAVQAKLLRVLQEREVRRIGETRGRPVDVRLIVASNANLDALVREGRFRRDLLYRLKVLDIKLPPLRNRRDDIPMLAHVFLERLNAANKTRKHFAPGIINQLMTQPFPGNVRELQNVVERAFFLAKSTIISDVPLEAHAEDISSSDEVQSWFKELSEGRKDFWSAVHNRYKRRDISREKVIALMDYGLRSTQGSYKMMAAMFHLKENEYRRFMDFLRRNNCLLDYRPYRKAARNTPAR